MGVIMTIDLINNQWVIMLDKKIIATLDAQIVSTHDAFTTYDIIKGATLWTTQNNGLNIN